MIKHELQVLYTERVHPLKRYVSRGEARYANVQAMCSAFKRDLLNGYHCFGVGGVRAVDSFKAALFYATGTLGSGTADYDDVTGNELPNGSGYTTGGLAVSGQNPGLDNNVAYWTPGGNFVWAGLTASGFDAVLIYNTTQGNRAVSVHTFGSQTITAGTFTLTMPTHNSTTGLIRLA